MLQPRQSSYSMKVYRSIIASVLALALVGCAQIAVVSEKHPGTLPPGSDVNQIAAQSIERGLTEEKTQPVVALGEYVAAVQQSLRELDRNPKNAQAMRTYDFAIARMFGVIRDAKLDPWTTPLRVGTKGEFTLTWKRDPRPDWNLALYELVPTDELTIKGTYVEDRVTKKGIGAPLVARRILTEEQATKLFIAPRIYYGITATAQFEGSRCVISAQDPLKIESVQVDGHSYPLAADFSASYAMLLAKEKPQKLGFARLLNPEKYTSTFRLARLEPYDPNKTVLLVIHGLMDTPVTWVPMLNDLYADPVIRHNYQFWFYSYPSGYAYPYSASVLRKQLDAMEKRFPLRKKMVVIGHSMGGCITRTLITDTGDKVWLDIFGKPPEQTEMPPDTKKMIEEAIIVKHRPEIGRVIFMSTPHRGADLATNWVGRIGSMLVRTPQHLITAGPALLHSLAQDPTALQLKRLPNSVDTLAPNNRFVRSINRIPITPGIPYHSIVGDRGRGDTPKSSDGVVAYWSSHLDGAQSEFIAPCDHSSPRNPQAIAEVHRILRLHINQKAEKPMHEKKRTIAAQQREGHAQTTRTFATD
jgi:pimeloyl-ACP methyl ester carboxylesterase